jgi:hypothetical protein
MPPQKIENDAVPGASRLALECGGELAIRLLEIDNAVRAKVGERPQRLVVAASGDDPLRAEQPGDLHSKFARESGCAMNQHGLVVLKLSAPLQRKERRQRGARYCGGNSRVNAVGNPCIVQVGNNRLFGHCAVGRFHAAKADELAILQRADAI